MAIWLQQPYSLIEVALSGMYGQERLAMTQSRWKLIVSFQKNLRNLENPKEIKPEKIEEIDDIIYGFSGDEKNNKFSAEVLKSVADFEKYLKPRLKL